MKLIPSSSALWIALIAADSSVPPHIQPPIPHVPKPIRDTLNWLAPKAENSIYKSPQQNHLVYSERATSVCPVCCANASFINLLNEPSLKIVYPLYPKPPKAVRKNSIK